MNIRDLIFWGFAKAFKNGEIQNAKVATVDNHSREDTPRPQDYGFTSNPVEAECLTLNVAGHQVIIRADRNKERPQAGGFEVIVWHKEGHKITLTDGKQVIIDADKTIIKGELIVEKLVTCQQGLSATGGAGGGAAVSIQGGLHATENITTSADVKAGNVSLQNHTNGGDPVDG